MGDELTMASSTISVDVRGMKRVRLFVHELETLRHEMRVMASPHAERLERAIERFYADLDVNDRGEGTLEAVEEIVEPCPRCGYEERA